MTVSFLRAALLLVLATVLSGCLSLGEPARITVYAPALTVETDPAWPMVDWSLLVMTPTASEMIDSPRIAVRPEPGILQVYKGAHWSDTVPVMLQSAVLRAFEDSGRIAAVGRHGSGVRGEHALLLDIRHFESVYPAPKSQPKATIEIQAKLMAMPGSRVLAAKTFRREVEAADVELPEVTAAFDTAATQVVADIVGWTLAQGQNNASKRQRD